GKPLQYDDTQEVMQEIAKGDFIKADWNPYMLMSYFPPAPGVIRLFAFKGVADF
ncbi:hypothetical protein GNQ40_34700, partial [Pseudomonas aeruginosa]|nr:hypothetical protein [Pseudomonas aeruginosa]